MKYIKTGLTGCGNKFRYLDKINDIVINKNYRRVYDITLGIGNILINLKCNYKKLIGIDSSRINIEYMNFFKNNFFTMNELEEVLKKFNYLKSKNDFYNMRSTFNKLIESNNYNKLMILLFLLINKTSFSRFYRTNVKGLCTSTYGFTKINSELISNIYNLIINFRNYIKSLNTDFIYSDSVKYLKYITEKDLIIFDPPYILQPIAISSCTKYFNEDKLSIFLKKIKDSKSDFIGFDYLRYKNKYNKILSKFIKRNKLRVIIIRDSIRERLIKKNRIKIKEIIYTNIKGD